VIAGAVLGVSGLGAGAPAAAVSTAPTLAILSVSPLQVRGADFAARERVRVTFEVAGSARAVVVRTTARGTFTVAVPGGVMYDPCGALLVNAQGQHGETTFLRRPPRECAPA
jgi:hypothetical protein